MTAARPAVVFHMVTIHEIKDQSFMTIIAMFPNETRRYEILLSLSLCMLHISTQLSEKKILSFQSTYACLMVQC
jgi:hypothetical protein